MSFRWYLVRAKPGSETLATEHLERQGFAVYYPRVAAPVRSRGRLRTAIRPLFPRYLFLGLGSPQQSLGSVGYTRGVSGFVKFGAEIAMVPARVVEGLRRCADPQTGLHDLKVARLFAGARVRVVDGTFEGLEGIFERECDDTHVVVVLDLLGQSARVCLRSADIVAHDMEPTPGAYGAGAPAC